MIGETINVEGFGSLDAGVTGLDCLLWGGKVFTSEDVNIRVALYLCESTEPVENCFDHDGLLRRSDVKKHEVSERQASSSAFGMGTPSWVQQPG